MEQPIGSPDDSFELFTEEPDLKSSLLSNLMTRLNDNEIPSDAVIDWLDVVFRNEVVPDNNIVWALAVRNFSEHLTTEQLAEGFEHTQWRAALFEGQRFAIKISTSLLESDNSRQINLMRESLKNAHMMDLYEADELRAKLLKVFQMGATLVEYEYFVNADDIDRTIDDFEKIDIVLFDTDEYVRTFGQTSGICVFYPDVSITEYFGVDDYAEFITTCQVNVKFNESLWDDIENSPVMDDPVERMVPRV